MVRSRRHRAILAAAMLAGVTAAVATWDRNGRSRQSEPAIPPPPFFPDGALCEPRVVAVTAFQRVEGYAGVKPVVGADHRGRIALVAQAIRDEPLLSEIVAWHSVDRGATWSQPRRLTQQPAGAAAHHFDPWLESDRRGRFFLLYGRITDPTGTPRDYSPAVRRTSDGGARWSAPFAAGKLPADRPVLAVSPDGAQLVVAGAARDNYEGPGTGWQTGCLHRSTDGGESWQRLPDPVPRVHAIPYSIAVDRGGRIAAGWVEDCRSFLSISRDGGQSWHQRTLVPKLRANVPHCFNGGHFAVLAVDERSRLHVAYLTAEGSALMFQSTSDWQTWEDPRQLSTSAQDECAFAAIDAWGPLVHVLWLERRGELWNAYYRLSTDRGRSWTEPLPLTDGTTGRAFRMLPDEQTCIADDGNGRAHAVWATADGRVHYAAIDLRPDSNLGQR